MITKLYKLKKQQTQQQLIQKQQLLAKINGIDEEIMETTKSISSASVQALGAINDFKVLEIHKNTMRSHIVKLEQQKVHFNNEVQLFNQRIVELNKETEQFKYLKDQEDKAKFKKMIKAEEEMASEFVQAQWVAS